jgi:hypothetical protein
MPRVWLRLRWVGQVTGESWVLRVHWRPAPGVTCPEYTTYPAESETCAIDDAVSILDGTRHPRALVKAVRAEIRRTGDPGPWLAMTAD